MIYMYFPSDPDNPWRLEYTDDLVIVSVLPRCRVSPTRPQTNMICFHSLSVRLFIPVQLAPSSELGSSFIACMECEKALIADATIMCFW